MTGDEVVARLGTTYANARSYADRGVVTSTFRYPDRERVVRLLFETAFVRPDRFRFEYRDDDERMVIWTDGQGVHWWWTIDPEVHDSDLNVAIGGATGVSGGSAHTVPRLLLPGVVDGRSLAELGSPRVDGVDDIDGHACYRVRGELAGRPLELWVDERMFAIRRIVGHWHVATHGFDIDVVTSYEPSLDPVLDDAMFCGVAEC